MSQFRFKYRLMTMGRAGSWSWTPPPTPPKPVPSRPMRNTISANGPWSCCAWVARNKPTNRHRPGRPNIQPIPKSQSEIRIGDVSYSSRISEFGLEFLVLGLCMWSPSLGAWPDQDGTHFRVWAPTARRLEVVLENTSKTAHAQTSNVSEPSEISMVKEADGTF